MRTRRMEKLRPVRCRSGDGATSAGGLEYGHRQGEIAMQTLMLPAARAAVAVLLLGAAASSLAQTPSPRPTVTRLLVTEYRVKPDMVGQWLALQRNEVVPALKKAGVAQYTVYQTVIGDASDFTVVTPLKSFGEFDGPDALERALGAQQAAALSAKLGECTESIHRRIENRQDEFYIDPGAASALFASSYRAMPGRSQDYMSFIRAEMFPVMQTAKENGTFAGLSVTVSVQGGEAGIITLNMHYPDFAPLDGPPPVAKTLGPEGTREFITKGAGLITPLEQLILKRVAEISF